MLPWLDLKVGNPDAVGSVTLRETPGGITFAGFGISRNDDGQLTPRSPLLIGFHTGTVNLDGNNIRTEYQWSQDLGAGKDALCGGDSGGPIYAGLVRGHQNTMPHRIVAVISRVTPPGAPSAISTAQGPTSSPKCYQGKINVVALAPWRQWICQKTQSQVVDCTKQ